jgi:hypothetical protein
MSCLKDSPVTRLSERERHLKCVVLVWDRQSCVILWRSVSILLLKGSAIIKRLRRSGPIPIAAASCPFSLSTYFRSFHVEDDCLLGTGATVVDNSPTSWMKIVISITTASYDCYSCNTPSVYIKPSNSQVLKSPLSNTGEIFLHSFSSLSRLPPGRAR